MKFRGHNSACGHGSDFLDVDIRYGTANFIGGYGKVPGCNANSLIVWLKGQSTYYFRGDHFPNQPIFDSTDSMVYLGQTLTSKTSVDTYVMTAGQTFANNIRVFGQSYLDGSVGIGTTAPSAGLKLDVEGNVGATQYCDQNGANCKLITTMGVDTDWVESGGNVYRQTGKVEVGSTSSDYLPSAFNTNYNLQLNSLDTSSIGFHDSGFSMGSIRFKSNLFTIGADDGWGVANTYFAGNVGIGTSPGYKLDVAGDVRLTGNIMYGDSDTRTYSRADIGLQGNAGAKSGFYQTSAPAPAANWYPGASSWQHFIDVRHSNPNNNYALQIAGSFFDQELYFRKTNGAPTTGWNKFVYQNSAGNVGIGTTNPGTNKLEVAGNTKITGDLNVTGTITGGNDESNFYTAVLGLKTSTYCPAGWELNAYSNLRGSDGYLYIVQTKNMFFMGRSNSHEFWQEYITEELHTNNQVNYICSKTFNTTKNPYAAVFMSAMTTNKCPSEFTYVPASELKRNDGWSYFQAVEGNFYMGGLNNWWRSSQQLGEGGVQGRQWNTYGQGVCYNVFNVDGKGSKSAKGIFPVVLTLQSAAACPAGFASGSMADLSAKDGYMHIVINDNSATFGAVESWWGSDGENTIRIRTHKNFASTLCWKFYETIGEPRMEYRLINSGNCPSGYTSIATSQLIGPNNGHGHIMSTPYGSYMGALDDWGGIHSFSGGASRYWFDSTHGSKVCFKVDNAI